VEEVEGVGGGAGKGVAVEDFFGEGTDEGLAAEFTAEALLGLSQDVLDVEGAVGGLEYVFDDGDIRLTFMVGSPRPAGLGWTESAKGAELGMGRGFEDIQELIAREGIGVWRCGS
jgi:hypothetical protein